MVRRQWRGFESDVREEEGWRGSLIEGADVFRSSDLTYLPPNTMN